MDRPSSPRVTRAIQIARAPEAEGDLRVLLNRMVIEARVLADHIELLESYIMWLEENKT